MDEVDVETVDLGDEIRHRIQPDSTLRQSLRGPVVGELLDRRDGTPCEAGNAPFSGSAQRECAGAVISSARRTVGEGTDRGFRLPARSGAWQGLRRCRYHDLVVMVEKKRSAAPADLTMQCTEDHKRATSVDGRGRPIPSDQLSRTAVLGSDNAHVRRPSTVRL
jgi:hypothetical protein